MTCNKFGCTELSQRI